MDKSFISTYSPVLVVLISFVGSWLISRYSAHKEVKKYKYQIYADKLHAKRLDVYPQFYYLVSNFLKNKTGVITIAMLKDIDCKFSDLDSQYSIFFSSNTTHSCHVFRMTLSKAIGDAPLEAEQDLNKNNYLVHLFKDAARFEIALKGDLGVFMVEFNPSVRFDSYEELALQRAIGKYSFRKTFLWMYYKAKRTMKALRKRGSCFMLY